jgi:hypothetical protein
VDGAINSWLLLVVVRFGVLRRFVMANSASRNGAYHAMMIGHMTGYAADYRTFYTALGFGCACRAGKDQS